jgi:hypothetical protein
MSPDGLLIVMTSLGFATVFLALMMSITDNDAGEMVAAVANMSPAARRQAKFQKLDSMTKLADEAIEARKLGKRIITDQDY